MSRIALWVVLLVAVGATLFLVLPMLLGGAEDPAGDLDRLEHGGDDGSTRDAASLVGLPGAAERLRRSAGQFHITGRVITTGDARVAGVRVVARVLPDTGKGQRNRLARSVARIDDPEMTPPEPVAEDVSAEDGTFTLALDEPGRILVAAHPEPPLCGSQRTFSLNVDRPRMEIALRVEPGTPLRGRVLDVDDTGVEAAVTLGQWRRANETWTAGPVTSAADDGSFAFSALRPGTWYVTVRVPGRASLSGLRVDLPRKDAYEIRLGEGAGTLVGRVTSPGDVPAAGASILVSTGTRMGSTGRRATVRGITDEHGAYRIALVPAGEVTDVVVLHDASLPYEEAAPLAEWSGAQVKAGETTTLDVELKSGAVVEGRVVDGATGAPLAGAEVFIAPPQDLGIGVLRGTSDAEGRYRIEDVPPGGHLVLAEHATHYLPELEKRVSHVSHAGGGTTRFEGPPRDAVLRVRETDTRLERNLVLLRGCTLRGRVLGPGDAPVAGAGIHANQLGAAHAAGMWGATAPYSEDPPATSDEEGRFEIAGLPPRDDWTFYAAKKPWLPVAAAAVALSTDVPSEEITLRLQEGATLAGRVLAPDGSPVEARVYAYPVSHDRTVGHVGIRGASDLDGWFRLEGVPVPACRLSIHSQGWGSHQQRIEDLKPGEVREGIEVRYRAGVRVTGTLVDPDGRGIPNRQIQIQSMEGSGSRNAKTDADGRFMFENAPEGKVQLQVFRQYRRGRSYGSASEQVGEAFESPAEDVRVEFRPAASIVLEGRVLDPDGAPVPLCRVTVRGSGAPSEQHGWSTGEASRTEVLDGHFRREAEGKAPFTVWVGDARDADGHPLNLRPTSHRVEEAETADVEIRLERGQEVKGRVIGPDGAGVSDVLVYGPPGSTLTDDRGAFRLGGFREAGETLQAIPPKGWVEPGAATIDDPGLEILLRIQRAVEISGIVLDEDDEPVKGIYLTVQWTKTDGAPHYAGAQVGNDGRFTIEGVPEDVRVELTARTFGARTELSPVVVKDVAPGTENLVIRMSAGVRIEGTVVDHEGRPFSGAYVTARRGDDWSTARHAEVGSDGSFVIRGAEPGRYRLRVQRQGSGVVPAPVDVVAPATGVRIVIPEALRIRGTVKGEGDLTKFRAVAYHEDGNAAGQSAVSKVAADGSFTIERIPEGPPCRVRVSRSGDERYGLSEPVKPGTEDVRISLVQGRAIEGTLDGPDGNTVASGYVWVKSTDWSSGAMVKEGRFRIVGLPPGRYTCKAMVKNAQGGWGQSQDGLAEVEAGDVNVRLRLE